MKQLKSIMFVVLLGLISPAYGASDCSEFLCQTCWEGLTLEARCSVSINAPPCPDGTIAMGQPICDKDGFFFIDQSHLLSCFAYAAATRRCYKPDVSVHEGETTEHARVFEVTSYKETQDHCSRGPIGSKPFLWSFPGSLPQEE